MKVYSLEIVSVEGSVYTTHFIFVNKEEAESWRDHLLTKPEWREARVKEHTLVKSAEDMPIMMK